MYRFETSTASVGEADRIARTFYRFLERQAPPPDCDAYMCTAREAQGHLVQVRLWSADALAEFRAQLAS